MLTCARLCRKGKEHELNVVSSLSSFNVKLNAWLHLSTEGPTQEVSFNAASRDTASSTKTLTDMPTETGVGHCRHTNAWETCIDDDDFDIFYLPPPPQFVSAGVSVSTDGAHGVDCSKVAPCGSATLTTSAHLPANPQVSPQDGTSIVATSLSCDESSHSAHSTQHAHEAPDAMAAMVVTHKSMNIPECSNAREDLLRTEKLLQVLQTELASKQKLLERLGRMRARQRALKITELVSQKQSLQKQVTDVESLVATLLQHQNELLGVKLRCEAQVRAAVATGVRCHARSSKVPRYAGTQGQTYRHLETNEVYATCGVGVWQSAKIFAHTLKRKSKRFHDRAKAAMQRNKSDDSMHQQHVFEDEIVHGNQETEENPLDSGVFVAAMECAEHMPSTYSIAVSELATRCVLLSRVLSVSLRGCMH